MSRLAAVAGLLAAGWVMLVLAAVAGVLAPLALIGALLGAGA